jgi:hypothetical protein
VHLSRLAAVTWTVAVFVGCGGATPAEPPGPPPGTTLLTTSGGTATSADGRAVLVFPAGALAGPTTITIRPATTLPSHPRLIPGTAYTFEPEGITFAQPVRLTIRYGSSVPPAQRRYLWLRKWTGGDWVPMLGAADTVQGLVQGEIAGFSSFGAAVSSLANALTNLVTAVGALLSDPTPDAALAVLEALAAVFQLSDLPEYQAVAAPTLDELRDRACTGYADAVSDARSGG